jgi:hypothetical protein
MKDTGAGLVSLPYYRAKEARANNRLDHSKYAHRELDEATQSANLRSEHWGLAEFERLRGESSLSLSCENSGEATKHYERALKIAREQEAKSLELRPAMSLACLWAAIATTTAGLHGCPIRSGQ